MLYNLSLIVTTFVGLLVLPRVPHLHSRSVYHLHFHTECSLLLRVHAVLVCYPVLNLDHPPQHRHHDCFPHHSHLPLLLLDALAIPVR